MTSSYLQNNFNIHHNFLRNYCYFNGFHFYYFNLIPDILFQISIIILIFKNFLFIIKYLHHFEKFIYIKNLYFQFIFIRILLVIIFIEILIVGL